MNVWTKSSNSCQDVSLKLKTVNSIMALRYIVSTIHRPVSIIVSKVMCQYINRMKNSTCWVSYSKHQGISVTRIHPLGTMTVSNKVHGNHFNSCWNISVWTDTHSHISLAQFLTVLMAQICKYERRNIAWSCSRNGKADSQHNNKTQHSHISQQLRGAVSVLS